MDGRGVRGAGAAATLRAVLVLTLLTGPTLAQTAGATVGGLRLTGHKEQEGNILVEVNGVWGYICDDNFGFDEADAVCGQLGFPGAVSFTRNRHFGVLTPERPLDPARIVLASLNCSGAASWGDCEWEAGDGDCGRLEVAGVVCRSAGAACETSLFPCDQDLCLPRDQVCDGQPDCSDASDEAARLCGEEGVTRLTTSPLHLGSGAAAGLVELKHQARWGSVCDDNFTRADAQVLCRSLGYDGSWGVGFVRALLGEGSGPMWLEGARCRGSEEYIEQCPGTLIGTDENDCISGEDVSLFCANGGGEVRIADRRAEGLVEVRLGDEWGPVCGERHDDLDARVVCGGLGYTGAARAYTLPLDPATPPPWQLHLDCLGNETSLAQCRVRLPSDPCTSAAAVACSNTRGELNRKLDSVLPRDCGRRLEAVDQFVFRRAKLRGGLVPSRFDAPWLASLRSSVPSSSPNSRPELLCGATIITEYHVITASHCLVKNHGRRNLRVRVGDYDSDFIEDSEEEYEIDKVFVHEQFNINSFNDNDIAIIKIEPKHGKGFRFSSHVRPVCLPRVGVQYESQSGCTIIGWGDAGFLGSRTPRRPEEGKVKHVADWVCEQPFSSRNLTSSFICTGGTSGLVNVCNGDSGGPVACRNTATDLTTLHGVISSGVRCSFATSPDFHTRVEKYLRWIYEKLSQ